MQKSASEAIPIPEVLHGACGSHRWQRQAGRAVIAELLAHGWTVVNLDRAPTVPMPEEVCRFTRIDFTDHGQTVEALTSIDGGRSPGRDPKHSWRYEGRDAAE